MATGNVIVTTVDVGQGQCTFIEIYDDASTPKLIHALLIDCGSDHKSTQTMDNLKYIALKVAEMTKPTFDCIFFSHSDKDHVSLTKDLLDYFPKSKTPKVSEVWYGGYWDQYEKDSFNILDHLVDKKYCKKEDIKTTGANYTGYNANTAKYSNYLWQSTNKSVYVYPIASNALSDDPDWDNNEEVEAQKTPEAKNRVSIICGLYYAGVSYVICGDATSKTLSAVNRHFVGTAVFNKNIMTTLPHHGSRTTGYAVKSGAKASVNNKAIVTTFAALMKSKTITVSAYQLHKHPSLEVMVDFAPAGAPILKDARLKQKNSHRVTSNIDLVLTIKTKSSSVGPSPAKKKKISGETISKGTDRTCETDTNMFTTHYSLSTSTFSYKIASGSEPTDSQGVITPTPTFNNFACWRHTTQTNGDYTVTGYPKLGGTSFTAAPTAFVAPEEEPAALSLPLPGKSSVFVRIKAPELGKPVNTRPAFRSRLMQFR
jgi:hypothetical protein